jgi:hypothetical protein
LLRRDIFDCTTYAHRSAHHDILGFTAMPFFWYIIIFLFSSRLLIVRRATIFCFYRDAYLLKQHDIFDFTAMPSFDASR